MKSPKKLPAVVLAILLAACLFTYYSTRDSVRPAAPQKKSATAEQLVENGISVGDWVEIEGVSGEVIEIGLLKTVLLELGNWTSTGHPTGRRVAFSNSFAMERHYFNFSTSSQWLRDELQVTLPQAGDPYQTAQQIREIVERETRADAAEAAKDWQCVGDSHKSFWR